MQIFPNMTNFSVQFTMFCFVSASQVLGMNAVLETAIFSKCVDIFVFLCFM